MFVCQRYLVPMKQFLTFLVMEYLEYGNDSFCLVQFWYYCIFICMRINVYVHVNSRGT